ncbi:GGDEF domain-containing protein [Actinoplanes sp. NPDC051633]|uniref:GGDEF domain-containing protein n=1 Tax=Actinoplanes sp. NPDC051633 TaxID=3155670 RepID=UPI0034151C9C
MSPILTSIVTALGGVLAGLAAAGMILWRQQQSLNRWQHLAHHDDTTGMPNRRALLAALRRALRNGDHVGLIVLDLDGFKTINDTYGHEDGNHVLAAVGRRLTALTHPVRLAARLSGDEYALLVTGTNTEHVAYAANTAWQAVGRDPIPVADTYLKVSASVGHVTAGTGATPADLLRAADMAMYEAKQTGTGIHAATTHSPRLPRHTRYRDLPRT